MFNISMPYSPQPYNFGLLIVDSYNKCVTKNVSNKMTKLEYSFNMKKENINKEKKYNFYQETEKIQVIDLKLLNNLKKIKEIGKLQDNWNGNDAPKFASKLLSKTIEILKCLPTQPDIFPTAMESIQLEYEKTGKYLEFNIFKNDKMEIFYESETETYEKTAALNIDTILQEVRKFND